MPNDPNLPPQTDPVPPVTDPPADPPAAPPIDYEKKFKESTRENQILHEKLKAQEEAGKELTKEPTDSDLRAAFQEWDTLSDFEKKIARDNLVTKSIAARAHETAQALQSDREWNTSIEIAVSSDPSLQGKEQAFRQFASKPQYRNTPMDVLVAAFLQKNPSAPVAPPTPRPGLQPGNGGPRTPEKPPTLSTEDLSKLRQTDPKAYQDYLKTHPIDIEV